MIATQTVSTRQEHRTSASRLFWHSSMFILCFFLLSSVYSYYAAVATASLGYENNFNYGKFYLSLSILLLISIITSDNGSTRNTFLNIFVLFYIIPSLVIFCNADKDFHYIFAIFLSYSLVFIFSAVRIPRIVLISLNTRRLTIFLLLCTYAYLLHHIVRYGLSSLNFDIRQVYDFRSEFSEQAGSLFGYITTVLSKSIIIIGLILSISARRYLYFLMFLISSIVLFGIANHRGILFYPIVAVGIYISLSISTRFSLLTAIISFILIICLFDSYMYYEYGLEAGWGWIVDIFARRGLLTPAYLDYLYLEFFENNPHYLWSGSRITFGYVPSPYDLTAPYLIGDVFFNKPTLAANTGFIGNGFAQAGWVGITLYSIGVGLVIAFIASYGRRLGVPTTCAIFAVQVITMFTGTDFLTMLLTHGLLASLLLLTAIRPPRPKSRSRLLRNSSERVRQA